MRYFLFVLCFLFSFSQTLLAQTTKQEQRLIESLWTLEDSGFIEPESIAFDSTKNKIFVTNVNGYLKNGAGFISRINADGTDLELKWIKGLNGPTGIVHHKERLYFADIDTLKVANATSGEIVAEYPAPDPNPSLNDVAIDEQGVVYVSASNIQTIYKLKAGELIPLVRDEQNLKYANGIWVQNGQLITGGETLHLWRATDGRHLRSLTSKDSVITNIDGVSMDNNGNIIVSLLDDPRLWLIKPSGQHMPLSKAQINGVDFHLNDCIIYAPRINVEQKRYRVSAYRYLMVQ